MMDLWWMWPLLSVVLYGVIGFTAARRDVPAAWRRARRDWASESSIRESVQMQYLMLLFFWPLIGPVRAAMNHAQKVTDRYDPRRIEKENRELKREIDRLEREAGLR